VESIESQYRSIIQTSGNIALHETCSTEVLICHSF